MVKTKYDSRHETFEGFFLLHMVKVKLMGRSYKGKIASPFQYSFSFIQSWNVNLSSVLKWRLDKHYLKGELERTRRERRWKSNPVIVHHQSSSWFVDTGKTISNFKKESLARTEGPPWLLLWGKNESETLKIEEKFEEWLKRIMIKILGGGERDSGKVGQISFQEINFTGLLELAGRLCEEPFQWLP